VVAISLANEAVTARFSVDWLDRREPIDARSRDPELLARLAAALPHKRVLEFGCGTGSLLRALLPQLQGPIVWHMLDIDPQMLAVARHRLLALHPTAESSPHTSAISVHTATAQIHVEFIRADAVLLPTAAYDAVVASGWTDLVSVSWLTRLAVWAAQQHVSLLYLALNLDGRVQLDPAAPEDLPLFEAFHADMRRDKGLGTALGPDAPAVLARVLTQQGYRLHWRPSDWMLSLSDAALMQDYLAGVAAALAPRADLAALMHGWQQRRALQLTQGRLSLQIGHRDLLAQYEG
jgi:SAM-dependent methyltransferase